MEQATKITTAWDLHGQGVSNSHTQGVPARTLCVNRGTVNRGVAGVRTSGLLPFLESYRSGLRQPRPSRQVPTSLKQKVWSLRDREGGTCGQKIAYFLLKEEGIKLSVPKIYEILDEKYTLGNKHSRRRKKRGPVSKKPFLGLHHGTLSPPPPASRVPGSLASERGGTGVRKV